MAAVVGCSASGDTGEVPATNSNPTEPSGNTLPPSNGSDNNTTGATDAGKKDSGSKDAGKGAAKDSGAPAPAPGSACTTLGQTFKKDCGKCGFAEALCLEGDGGTGVVGDYGTCQAETGECKPGDSQACGNCGTQTCDNSCGWGSCTGEPANSCAPGSTDITAASCPTANTFRSHTCGNDCKWPTTWGTCESPSLTVNGTVGQVNSGNWTLSPSLVSKAVSGFGSITCPASSLSYDNVSYFAVPVTNNTGKAATVQIYHSGTAKLDTVIAVYNGSTVPTSDADLKACVAASDYCSALSDICGNGSSTYAWAGVDNIAIPAGGTVMVYSAGYSDDVTGPFTLNVKTTKLQ